MACGGGVTTGAPSAEPESGAGATAEAFGAAGSGLGMLEAGGLCPIQAVRGPSPSRR